MHTHQQITPSADKRRVMPGALATAVVWFVLYMVIFTVPMVSKFASIGAVVAFLSP